MDIIRKRKSIRSFEKGYIIEKKDYDDLLEAAICAPSAMNSKSWFFIVIDDENVKTKLVSKVPSISRFDGASGFIIVCAKKEMIKTPLYHQDLAAATENILLEATKKDLASCWIGLKDTLGRIPMICEILGVPEDIELFSMIALGKPLDKKTFDEEKKPVVCENIINYNGWVK